MHSLRRDGEGTRVWHAAEHGVGSSTGRALRSLSPALGDLPPEERPRERLARHGAGALSDRELVAVLLGTGSQRTPVMALADELVALGLSHLAGRTTRDLVRVTGLGAAKAGRLCAALELGRRVASGEGAARLVLHTPEEVGAYLLPRHGARPVEVFGLLVLDARQGLKHEALVSQGCLTASLVHPREVFQEAITARAASIVLFHNHPSGDPEPSPEDVGLTRRLAAAGSLMGIEVLDHVVLGAGRFVSLKQRGVL
jgi:DNA repair protein RadC